MDEIALKMEILKMEIRILSVKIDNTTEPWSTYHDSALAHLDKAYEEIHNAITAYHYRTTEKA